MGMDQNFYIMKKRNIPVFIIKMRTFFKWTPTNSDFYLKTLDSVKMEEIGYARKSYTLHDLIVKNVPGASKDNGGWTHINDEGLQKCFVKLVEREAYKDEDLLKALQVLTEVCYKKLCHDMEKDDSEDYGIVYSANW